MDAAHDQQDREQTTERCRAERGAGTSAARVDARVDVVEERRDAPCVHCSDHAIEQDHDVDQKDSSQDIGLQEEPEELQVVDAECDAAEQSDEQEWRGGKRQGSRPGPGIGVTEPGKHE